MLTKLELSNFKSHRHTEFNFDDSRLQAIVGQNSSGKTSVLQALNYLSQLSTVKIAAYEKYVQYHDALTEFAAEIGANNVTSLEIVNKQFSKCRL
jgi:AAA15 family ATPase/GTPase